MRTVLLLIASNTFMTIGWYGHLRYKTAPLLATILVSWLIALPEYSLQVPANRWGNATFSAPQLKVIQEAISLAVFLVFAIVYLKVPIRWNNIAAFLLVLSAVAVALIPGR